jgi:lysozyme
MLYHRVKGHSVDMELSAAGLELLKRSEGFVGHTYKDVAGVPTIGYGHRLLVGEYFPDGVTQAEAELMLKGDLAEVYAAIERLVKVPLTQGQFDAIADFVYNLGQGSLQRSTLLKELNANKYDTAAAQILLWDHAGGVENAALRRRREAEYKLWIAEKTPNERPQAVDL